MGNFAPGRSCFIETCQKWKERREGTSREILCVPVFGGPKPGCRKLAGRVAVDFYLFHLFFFLKKKRKERILDQRVKEN